MDAEISAVGLVNTLMQKSMVIHMFCKGNPRGVCFRNHFSASKAKGQKVKDIPKGGLKYETF